MVRSRVKYDVTPEDQMVEAEEVRERFNDLVDLVGVMDRLGAGAWGLVGCRACGTAGRQGRE